MTYELLLALFLAISPYLDKNDAERDSIYDLTAEQAVARAQASCRNLIQLPSVKLFDLPLGQFVDEMVNAVPPEQLGAVFAEDMKPKLNKLGLDYDEAVNFYLSVCHAKPSEKYLPDQKRIESALDLLRNTRQDILVYLNKHPFGIRPGSKDSPYGTVFRLADGKKVFDSGDTSAPWLSIGKIPVKMQQALVAVEDKGFHQHHGIDVTSLIRAAGKSMEGRYQGGSTITQQLIKNIYYFNKRAPKGQKNPRLRRKLGEFIVARELEKAWGKQGVLEAYFNIVNFGRGAKGISGASRKLFGKPVADLDLKQITTLAAMPKKPGAFVHQKNFDQLKRRQHYVLSQMQLEGYLTKAQVEANKLTEFPFVDRTASARKTSPLNHYIRMAKKDSLYKRYRKNHGVDAVLSLHPAFQKLAETSLVEGLLEYEKKFNKPTGPDGVPIVQGAVVIMDNETGDVLALQGGTPKVYKNGKVVANEFDRATRGYRQPGSTMKPFTYLMALESGLSPNDQIPAEHIELPLLEGQAKTWYVDNYNGSWGGVYSMRRGLERSNNLMTAWLLQYARDIPYSSYSYDDYYKPGQALDAVRKISVEFGVYCSNYEEQNGSCPKQMSTPKRVYPFILGAQETSLLRMTTAYARIANGGRVVTPRFIKQYKLAPKGNTAEAYEVDKSKDTKSNWSYVAVGADPRSLFQLKSMLVGVTQRGTGAKLAKYGDRVAGKTGTTDDYRDAWFIGFTSSVTIGVWVGYVDRQSLGSGATGGKVALPIFEKILHPILNGDVALSTPAGFPIYNQHASLLSNPPSGLVAMYTNAKTGCPQQSGFLEYVKEEYSSSIYNEGCGNGYDDTGFASYYGSGGRYYYSESIYGNGYRPGYAYGRGYGHVYRDRSGMNYDSPYYSVPGQSQYSPDRVDNDHYGSSAWIMEGQ